MYFKIRKLSVRPYLAIVITSLFCLFQVTAVYAIARGYATDDTALQPGMVAALNGAGAADSPKVERATNESGDKTIGVTVNPDQNLVTTGSIGQQVYVQTDGEVEAYTSDLNGAPKSGDLLSVSPLRGILVVAEGTGAYVVGTAIEDFDPGTTTTQTVNKDDTSVTVKIDKIRINLDYNGNTGALTEPDSSLERLGRSIVGKDVGEIRVIVALIIFLIVLVAEGGIIYGAVSSAISSLGRNPLARKIIIHEMIRVIFIAITVLLFGLLAIYAILWI